MDSLIWLGVFVGIMFVVHRFGMGCCGGHGHGGQEDKHGHNHRNEETNGEEIGKIVTPRESPALEEFNGKKTAVSAGHDKRAGNE